MERPRQLSHGSYLSKQFKESSTTHQRKEKKLLHGHTVPQASRPHLKKPSGAAAPGKIPGKIPGSFRCGAIEFLDSENRGVGVEISILCSVQAEISTG